MSDMFTHPKPRALDAVTRAQDASKTLRAPQHAAPVRIVKRVKEGSLAHLRTDVECPQCGDACAHYRDASKRVIDCRACDRASTRESEHACWLVFGAAYARTGGR